MTDVASAVPVPEVTEVAPAVENQSDEQVIPAEVTEELLAEATKNFDKGIECLKNGDAESAVRLFCQALQTRVAKYGEFGLECATAYVKNGVALLRANQSNADVFGKQIEQAAAEKQDGVAVAKMQSELEKGSENSSLANNQQTAAATAAPLQAAGAVTEGADKADDNDVEPAAQADDENAEGEEDEEEGDDAQEEGNEQEEQEGAADGENAEADAADDDLQLAWENIETARVIYSKAGEDAHHLELAEVHELLGEVATERESFEEAVAEFQKALEHLNKGDCKNKRAMAAVHFKAALPMEFLDMADVALQHVEIAAKLLNECMEENKSGDNDAELQKELQEVANEVQAKVEDLKLLLTEREQVEKTMREALGSFKPADKTSEPLQPSSGAAAAPAEKGASVVDLGVVGRGKSRITPVPAGAEPAAGTKAATRKRNLEDLLAAGGETTTGFDAASDKAKVAKN